MARTRTTTSTVVSTPAVATLFKLATTEKFSNEAEVDAYALEALKKAGYRIKLRKSGNAKIDQHWPSKSVKGTGKGAPDTLLFVPESDRPVAVLDNKAPTESAQSGLNDSQYYIEGLRKSLPNEPSLPRIAAGYNGKELLLSYLNNDGKWVPLKHNGVELRDSFPSPAFIRNGISSDGNFIAFHGPATATDLRLLLPKLKTLYRVIPVLASGRAPIDFTIAMLTLRLLVEQHPDWGSWAEQPIFSPGTKSPDHSIRERLVVLAKRVLADRESKKRYGDIFKFHEKSDTSEVAFSFVDVVEQISEDTGHFVKLFELLDALPPLQGANFDIFGEVYQSIGDEATKKALGEFFTGRHIIAGVLPIIFERAQLENSFAKLQQKKIADIACGTGGFLTETLRRTKNVYDLSSKQTGSFACKAFFGYDLGHANASRARVNMYFAGDGFSYIEGGIDALAERPLPNAPKAGFDIIMTNPPYGKSTYGRAEEAFLARVIEQLKKGEGYGLIVLPTGVLENPRSSAARFNLVQNTIITDVIALPKHAFAPYTLQRTAIIIFQKRIKPIPVSKGDWNAILSRVGHEKLNLFIVDNDGYANSDKRYPTDKKGPNGEWLHNDLAQWIDDRGLICESRLVRSCIKGEKLELVTDEFGAHLGDKHGLFILKALADKERGINLLPDTFLRQEKTELAIADYLNRSNRLIEFRSDQKVKLLAPFNEELEFLLTHPVAYDKATKVKPFKVKQLFDIERGDAGLTEQVIYQNYDQSGIPVYGGGASKPRFNIKYNTLTNKGKKITIFEGPAIIVSVDGTAGAMRVIPSGKFCSNHHGRILKPKAEFNDLDLHWFVQQAERELTSLASNQESSATLTSSHVEEFVIPVPTDAKVLKRIGDARRALESVQDEFKG